MTNGNMSVSMSALSWLLAGATGAAAQTQAPTTPRPVARTPVSAAAPAQASQPGTTDPRTDPAASTPSAGAPSGAADAPAEEEGEEIVVTGQRPYGSVASDIKPEQTLNAGDVRAYGVSSISDLLSELAPQTNAAAGEPVVLLNGKRISSFREISSYPPEAIQRVEILPEDVSLAYGYAANQKVVNIILRRRFRAFTGEVGGGTTTEGGRENGRISGNLLQLRGTTRSSIDVTYTAADRLLESERDIDPTTPARPFALAGNVTGAGSASQVDPALSALAGRTVTVAAVPGSAATGRPTLAAFVPGANAAIVDDLGRYRTLSPATDNLAINANLARPLGKDVTGSLNARLEFSGSDSLQGLPGVTIGLPVGNPFSPFSGPTTLYRYTDVAGPLSQQVRGNRVEVGGTLNGQSKDWFWTVTGNYDRSHSRTESIRGLDTTQLQAAIDGGSATLNPFAPLPAQLLGTRLTDRASSTTSALTGEAIVNGPLFRMPAGKANVSITVNGAANDFTSASLRSGVLRELDYSRDVVGSKASIDLPLTSRRSGVGAAIGDLALNGNAEVQHLSDYGRITTLGYGLRWSPIPEIRFIGSMTHDSSAPSGLQVNNPVVVTPNVPVFDYRTGTTVYVSSLSGGNPALVASERQRLRLSLTARPWSEKDFSITALYTDNRTDDPVGTFPVPTPQIEAAFPQRFMRDANGTLLQVDSRPVNFAASRSSAFRYGFNFSMPLKSALQKKVEAWRAAGAKAEDRPKELDAMRELFGRGRDRREGARGDDDTQRRPDDAPRPDSDRAAGDGGGSRGGGDGPGGGGRGGGFGGGGFGGGGFGGGGRGGMGGGAGGRLQFALFHTVHLKETITIAPGVPVLDLLDGAAIGNSGGQARHEVEAQAGYSNNGIGLRLSGNWQSATRVDGALGTTNSTLRFGDLATLDLRLFANLGQRPEWVRAHPFLRGSRVSLAVTNLFDSKQDVRDGTGAVPLGYLPDRIDPLGRRVMLSFRKLFN